MLKKTPPLTKNCSKKVRWQKIPPATGRKTLWSTKKIVKKTREAKSWPARRTPTGWVGGKIKIKLGQGYLLVCVLKKNSKRSSPAGKVRRRPPPNIKKLGFVVACGLLKLVVV